MKADPWPSNDDQLIQSVKLYRHADWNTYPAFGKIVATGAEHLLNVSEGNTRRVLGGLLAYLIQRRIFILWRK